MDLIGVVSEAVALGLFLMLLVGPSFFFLIKLSIERGARTGAWFAVGIFFSDIIIVSGVFYGLRQVIDLPMFKLLFSAIAGAIVTLSGIVSLLRQHKGQNINFNKLPNSVFSYVARGFLINFLNPFTFFFWVGVLGTASSMRYHPQHPHFILFMASLLLTILATDIGKAILSNRIGKLLNPRVIAIVNIIIGWAFIVLGIRLLVYFVQLLTHNA